MAVSTELTLSVLLAVATMAPAADVTAEPLRVTILYDNAAYRPDTRAGWGFSCLITGTARTILFDAGAEPGAFAANTAAIGVDLSRLDAIVVSHPHDDHTRGLPVALKAHSGLRVHLPLGTPDTLSATLRAAGASVVTLAGPTEIAVDALVTGPVGGTIPEQALVIRRPEGLVVVTGCSHPGIVAILERVRAAQRGRFLAVLGGFHLLEHSDEAIAGIVARFQELGVERVGATHCTGARASATFRKAYGARFVEMGVGRVIELP